jgi:hypothetical protein
MTLREILEKIYQDGWNDAMLVSGGADIKDNGEFDQALLAIKEELGKVELPIHDCFELENAISKICEVKECRHERLNGTPPICLDCGKKFSPKAMPLPEKLEWGYTAHGVTLDECAKKICEIIDYLQNKEEV